MEGWEVVGFDIERHDYGTGGYPGHLVLQDMLTVHGSQFKDADCFVFSPPCTEFSYMAMPWSRGKRIARALRGQDEFPDNYTGSRTLPELKALFYACWRIQIEACHAARRYIPMIIENVCGAQPWVGRSRWHYGSFHLWGDVPALMPMAIVRPSKNSGGSWFAVQSNGTVIERNDPRYANNPAHAGEGTKVPGLNWSNYGKEGYKAQGFNVTNEQRLAESEGIKFPGNNAPRRWEDRDVKRLVDAPIDGTKQGGDWCGANCESSMSRMYGSKSPKRKAASALIAKIPLPLSRHIARVYKPERQDAGPKAR